jgi:hypothetical protein
MTSEGQAGWDGHLVLAVCARCGWSIVRKASESLPVRCLNPKCGAPINAERYVALERPLQAPPPA